MRAVFTFDLPRIKNEFIDNEKVVSLLQELGWAFQNITQMRPTDLEAIIQAQKSDREIREISRRAQELTSGQDPLPHEEDSLALSELCAPLFKEMPEVAAAERNATVFLGYIANDQTVFVVTRMIRGQVTFRLLHMPTIPKASPNK